MSKNSTLPKIIRILALVFLIHCLIGLSGCVTPPVIKIAKPTPDIIKEYKSVVVWAKIPGMFDTGVEVKRGDYVTILAEGEINIWPGSVSPVRESFIKKPQFTLLIRVGKDNSVVKYFGYELTPIYSEGHLYLGYQDSSLDVYGEPLKPEYYRDNIGHFVVDIIVWKTNDPILMAKFFEEASQRDPEKAALKEMATKFEMRKELFVAEQKAKRELAEVEKAITALQKEEVSKPTAPEKKVADPGPIVTAAKGKEPQVIQGLDREKKIPAVSPKPQVEKKPSLPAQEKAIPDAKEDEKEKKIAALNDRLQKAMQALHDVEEMKKRMAAQLDEQQKREEEVAARLEALEMEKTKQPKNIPVIAIATPKDGITVDSEYISLAGVAEHEKGIEKFEILLNGEPAHSKDQRGVKLVQKELKRIEFSERIRLREGKNEITIRAQEKEGMTAEKTIAVHMAKKKGEVWAVIIGINQYRNLPSLKYAVNDAREVYRYMIEVNRVPKDHIWLLLDEDATLDRIRSALGTQLRRKAGKEDMVIVYLAGHGATEQDTSSPDGDGLEKYILPHNADPKDLYASAIPMGEVSRIFRRIISEKLVFLSDTCYSGASGGRTILASGTRANISGAFW
ncbi:MAG: Polysaccharide deacetylase, partial [uncultured bacterium]